MKKYTRKELFDLYKIKKKKIGEESCFTTWMEAEDYAKCTVCGKYARISDVLDLVVISDDEEYYACLDGCADRLLQRLQT